MYHGIPQATLTSAGSPSTLPPPTRRKLSGGLLIKTTTRLKPRVDRPVICAIINISLAQHQNDGSKVKAFPKPQSHTPTSRQTASRSLAGQGMMCRNPKGMLEVSDTIARMRIWKHGCGDRRCRAASPQHSHFQRHTHTHTPNLGPHSLSALRRHRFPKDKIGSQAFVVQHTLAPPPSLREL